MRRIPFLFFFFSGASSLVLEVAWVRQFSVVLGNTVLSTTFRGALYRLTVERSGYRPAVQANVRVVRDSCRDWLVTPRDRANAVDTERSRTALQ